MTDLHQGFKRTYTPTFTKADGTPGLVDGTLAWESSDATVLIVTPSADSTSADITWGGAGSATITCRADGDLGAGVFPIVITDSVTLVAPLGATSGAFGIGDEVPAA